MNDNYSATVKGIISFILAHPLASCLRDRDVADLKAQLESDRHSYLSLDFRTDYDTPQYAECNLSVSLDNPSYQRISDAEGNEWVEYKVEARVSWASWGGTEPTLALKRVALMSEVATLAAAIQSEFGGHVYKLTATAADVAAREARRETQRIENLACDLVRSSAREALKGMRVGSERLFRSERLANLPHGRYEVTSGDKKFTLIHTTNDAVANVIRTN